MWLRGDELLEFRFVAQRLKVGVLRRSCGEFGIERERLFEHLKRLLRFSRPRQEAREVERAIPDLGSKATASLPMARARAYSFASTNRYASEVSARTFQTVKMRRSS
jgi:hypothetical protein